LATRIATLVDPDAPYASGAVAVYAEDAHALADDVHIHVLPR
jgi:hypothetical protein